MENNKIYSMAFSKVYPLYIKKAEKKGHTRAEVDEIIFWLTGYSNETLKTILEDQVNFENFFKNAPKLNENIDLIKGMICGYRIEDIENELLKKIRCLDKLIDELSKGKSMDKILRK